jgi:ankyrin repeat protein
MSATPENELIEAADQGNVPKVTELLRAGVHVNAIVNGRFNWTPLMHAAYRGHLECVQVLLDHGAEVNHACNDCFTAATLAASEGHWEIVRLLARHGANLSHKDGSGQSAKSYAERAGKSAILAES